MKLFTICPSCKSEHSISSYASTRTDIVMEKGERFNIQCKHCKQNAAIHVNKIRAKENRVFIIGGIIIGFLSIVFLWDFFGAISTVSGIIPILIWQQESNTAHAFNSYLI